MQICPKTFVLDCRCKGGGGRGRGVHFTLSASFLASRGLAAPLQLSMRDTSTVSSKNIFVGYHFWDSPGFVK